MKRILIIGVTSLLIVEFNKSDFLSSINVTNSDCIVKGNISHNSGRKLYHIPGMEDYQSTKIDTKRGERWFCSESEAIANGWQKAPK